jgi:hypothetical protein
MPRFGCSLASILLLVTLTALFAAALRSGAAAQTGDLAEAIVPAAVLGGLAGLPIGVAWGWHQPRRRVGIPVGVVLGPVGGVLAGLCVALPNGFLALWVGAAVIFFSALAMRKLGGRNPSQ